MSQWKTLAAAFLACSLAINAQQAVPSPAVDTASGKVSGTIAPGTLVLSFKGIPYAAPPVGDLRWRPPQPSPPWEGVRNGSKFGASCMQKVHGDLLPWTGEFLIANQVSEDCLFLNVWTPHADVHANLPVVVFVHGGAFTEGSGEVPVYDGENLAATGLVVITINYRLGAFGFLAHPALTAESPQHASGNYGLMDQIAALSWVRSNVRAFGGDPQRVTVWGQSAGAFSVGALLAAPKANGLFQRAMADSALSVAGVSLPTLKSAEAAGVRFSESRHAHTPKELRALPASELLLNPEDKGLRFSPILDGLVLQTSPQEANTRGTDSDVPVMTGYQANDGLLFSPPVQDEAEYQSRAEHMYGKLAPEFEQLYPGSSATERQSSTVASIRDRDRVAMYLWAQARVHAHHSRVYTYFFDRAIPWPQHPEFQAFHSGELPYFFRNLPVLNRPWESTDYLLSFTTSNYLKSFFSIGDPNGPGFPRWPAVDPSEPATMELGQTLQPMALADAKRLAFWQRYFASEESKSAPPF